MPTAQHTTHLIDDMADELWKQFIAFEEGTPYNTASLAEEHPKLVRELLELEEKFRKLFKLLAADPDLRQLIANFRQRAHGGGRDTIDRNDDVGVAGRNKIARFTLWRLERRAQ